MSLTNTNEYYVTNRGYKIAKRICQDIKDNFSRKRAFAALICMDTLADYLYSQGYNIDISKNLYKILPINEEFEFTDIHCNGYFIDVIPVVNERFMLIPKNHFENGIAPDLYVAASYSPITKKVKFAGCISSQDIDKSKQNEYYYIVRTDLLSAPDLVEETISIPRESAVSDNEHEKFSEWFIDYIDGNISENDKKSLMQHLIECKECRDKFVDFFDYEMIAIHTKQHPEVLADHTLGIVGATEANNERYKNFEEITLEIDKEPDEYAEDEEEEKPLSHKTIKPAVEDPLQILYGNKNNEMFDLIADKPVKKVAKSILTDIINDVQSEKATTSSTQNTSPKTGNINPEYYAEGLSEGVIEQKEETPHFIDLEENKADNTLSLEDSLSESDDLLFLNEDNDNEDTPSNSEKNSSINNIDLDKPMFLEEQENQEEENVSSEIFSESEDKPLFTEEDSLNIKSDETEIQNNKKNSTDEDLLFVDDHSATKPDTTDDILIIDDNNDLETKSNDDDDMLILDDNNNDTILTSTGTTPDIKDFINSDEPKIIENSEIINDEENDIDDLVQFDVEDVDLTDENDNEYESADDGTRSKVPNNLEEAGVVASSLLDYEDKNTEEFITAAKDRLDILQSEDNSNNDMLIIDDNDDLETKSNDDDDMLILDDNNSQEQTQNNDDDDMLIIDDNNDLETKSNDDDDMLILDDDNDEMSAIKTEDKNEITSENGKESNAKDPENTEQKNDLAIEEEPLPLLEDDFDFGELEDLSEDSSSDLTLEEPKEDVKTEEKDYFPEIQKQEEKQEEEEKDDIVLIDDDLKEKKSFDDDFSFDDNSFIRPAGASMPDSKDDNFVRPASVQTAENDDEDDDLVIIDDEEEESKDVTDFVRPASMWDFPDDKKEQTDSAQTASTDKQEDETEEENDDFNPADFEFTDDMELPSEKEEESEPQKAPSQLDIVLAGINKEKEKNPTEEITQNNTTPIEYNPNKNIFRQFKDAITAKEEAIEAGKFDDLEDSEDIEEPLINTTQTADDEDDDDLSYIDEEDVTNLQPQFYSKDFSDVETFNTQEDSTVEMTDEPQTAPEETKEEFNDNNEFEDTEEDEEYEEYEEEEIIDDSSENEDENSDLNDDESKEESESSDSSEESKKKKKLIAIIAASAVLAVAVLAGGGLAAKKFIFDKNQNTQTTETNNDILGGDTQTAEENGEVGGLMLPGDDNKPQPISEEAGGLMIPDDNSEGALGADMPAQTMPTEATTSPQQPTAPQVKEDSKGGLEAKAPQNVPTANANELSTSKISWGVGASLASSPDFKQYLQTTGKVIKANLNKDLKALKVARPAGTTKLMFILDETGKIESTATIKSCGSKQIDDFVLQSITQSIQTCSFPILPQDVLKANEQAVKSRNIKLSLTVAY